MFSLRFILEFKVPGAPTSALLGCALGEVQVSHGNCRYRQAQIPLLLRGEIAAQSFAEDLLEAGYIAEGQILRHWPVR